MSSNFWKIINGHTWSREKYNLAVEYLSLEQNTRMKWPKNWNNQNASTFRNRVKPYIAQDGKLVLKARDNSLSLNAQEHIIFEVIPLENIKNVLNKIMEHESTQAMSPTNLYKKIRQQRMIGISRQRIEEFLKTYQPLRQLRAVAKETVVKSYRPNYPMQHWQIDLIDFSKNANGEYKYIVVIIDIFSKFIYLYPLQNKRAESVSMALRKIFLSGDIPHIIGMDNGSEFNSLESICLEFNVKYVRSQAYRPQTQGFVENKNRQIKAYIALHNNKYKTNKWYDILDSVAFSINNTEHSVTKLTPMEVHRGRNVPVKVIQDKNLDEHYRKENFKNFDKMFHNSQYHEDFQNAERTLYEERVDIVRTRIHNEATKRESKQKNVHIRLNDCVKLGTFILRANKQVQPIQIRIGGTTIRNPTGLDKIEAKEFLSKTKKIRKWDWDSPLIPNSIFFVDKLIYDKNNLHPKLHLRVNDKNGKQVERLTGTTGSVENWTHDFHRNELLFIDNKDLGRQGIQKERPEYYPFEFDQQNLCQLNTFEEINNNNNNVGNIREPKKTTTPTRKQLYKFMNPFNIQFLIENYIVKFESASLKKENDHLCEIINWKYASPPWVLKSVGTENEKLDNLDVKYYNNSKQKEFSWYFVDKSNSNSMQPAELSVDKNFTLSQENLTLYWNQLFEGRGKYVDRRKMKATKYAKVAVFSRSDGIPDYAELSVDSEKDYVAKIKKTNVLLKIKIEGYGHFEPLDDTTHGWIFLNELNPIN